MVTCFPPKQGKDIKSISTHEGIYLTGLYLHEFSWKNNRIVDLPSNTLNGVPLPIVSN